MILRIFKGTGLGVILLVIFTLVIVWLGAFISPPAFSTSVYETAPMPLYNLLRLTLGAKVYIGQIFSLSIVVIISVLLVSFNTSVFIISERTFLPAFIYILFTGFFPDCQILNPVLPASLFVVLALRRIMEGYRKQDIISNFFDAAILIGTGSLFYVNLIWYGIIVFIGIAILRTNYLKEMFIALIGLATPWLLTFGFYYILDKDINHLISIIQFNFSGHTDGVKFSHLTVLLISYVALIVLISIANLIRSGNTKKIISLKTFTLLLWIFMISVAIYFILPANAVEIVWLISIPGSYLLAHYFILVRRRIAAEIALGLLVIFVLAIQIQSLF